MPWFLGKLMLIKQYQVFHSSYRRKDKFKLLSPLYGAKSYHSLPVEQKVLLAMIKLRLDLF